MEIWLKQKLGLEWFMIGLGTRFRKNPIQKSKKQKKK